MKVVLSRFAMEPSQVRAQLKEDEKAWPPPIPFQARKSKVSKTSKSSKNNDDREEDTDQANYLAFDFILDAAEPLNTYRMKVHTFKHGTPEDWVLFRIETKQFFSVKGIATNTEEFANRRHVIYCALLKGEVRTIYGQSYNKRTVENQAIADEDDRWSQVNLMQQVLNDIAKHIFKEWPKALKSEKRYMRQSLYIGDMKLENFFERVKKMNEYLLFFPFVNDDDDDPAKFK